MHQSRPSQVPIDEAWNSPNRIQGKPEHQVFGTVSPINGNHLIHLYTQFIYQPVSHSCKRLEELLIRPRLAFEDKKWMVRLFANLVFEDMVCKNALSGSAIGNEVDDILRL